MELLNLLKREFVYVWYYFTVQAEQILPYYLAGVISGSVISVFLKEKIHRLLSKNKNSSTGSGLLLASLLGIASPLCLYGTVPLAASLHSSGIREDRLAAFMMCSVLLNPQLMIYSLALGTTLSVIRFAGTLLCGILAGLLVHTLYKERPFFNFTDFHEPCVNRDIHPNPLVRLGQNLLRNLKITAPWFFLGVLLSALFSQYVPQAWVASLFGKNSGFGVLLAATLGVPLYACGGGTIPLLQQWLLDGMSIGSAIAFMMSGPATKITNLGALKMVLGTKSFLLYLCFICGFSVLLGGILTLFPLQTPFS